MRFRQINLDRYGIFTDRTIDLGERKAAGDMHIVYGPNEAGKSTFRSACLDFLFGFGRTTQYDFLHPVDVLQIGARVEFGGTTFEARRHKRSKNDFCDFSNEPISDAQLKSALGGVTRDGYVQMFSLDEHSLVAGGDSILSSKGDLGALLFSAASGLTALSSAIDDIENEANSFYKIPGRKYRLNDLLAELKQLDTGIKDIDVKASAYEKLRRTAMQADSAYKEAEAERNEMNRRQVFLKRLFEALPLWRDLTDILAELEVSDVPSGMPDEWIDEIERLKIDNSTEESRHRDAVETISAAEAELSKLVVNETVLESATKINLLRETQLEGRYKDAADIDKRKSEIRILNDQISKLLSSLGTDPETDPNSLLLTAPVAARLRALLDDRGAILADEASAHQELSDATRDENQAQEELDALSEFPDMTSLKQVLEANRTACDDRSLQLAKTTLAAAKAKAEERLSGLSPWAGTCDDLKGQRTVAAEDIETLRDGESGLQNRKVLNDQEITRLTDEIRRLTAETTAAVSESGIVDDRRVQEALQNREDAWRAHLSELEDKKPLDAENCLSTANEFRSRVLETDTLHARQLAQAGDIADLRQSTRRLAVAKSDLEAAEQTQHALIQEKEALDGRRTILLASLKLAASLTLAELERWLELRKAALEAISEQEETTFNVQRETEAKTVALAAIRDRAITCGLEAADNEDDLLAMCDSAISAWQAAVSNKQTALDNLKRSRQIKQRREEQANRSKLAADKWREDWKSTVNSIWIGGRAGESDPDSVKAILQVLEDLSSHIGEVQRLEERVLGMESNKAAYRDEVRRIASACSMEFDDDEPLKAADALRAALSDAQNAIAERKPVEREIGRGKRAEEGAKVALARIKNELSPMESFFGAEGVSGVASAVKASIKKQELERQTSELKTQITRAVSVATFEVALAALEENASSTEAIETLEREHNALEASSEDRNSEVSRLYHEWKTAEAAFQSVGQDGDVARMVEQRESLLLQIEQETVAHLQAVAGVHAARRALQTFRETHRSALMTEASNAFVAITEGGFKGLYAAPGKDGEILVGSRGEGKDLAADDMSRGTRFQLYLALRIAGHSAFAANRPPLPFFADDILEPFDDDRAAQTFRLMAEMSKHGQVIYLTHHKHLLDVAKYACGEALTVHTLPKPRSSLAEVQTSNVRSHDVSP
ncbi:MAG: hypothetical protein CML99_14605 [Rhodobiaceae bacterium]|nr:hypothetical protein [Rhodobiaceae bacterium]